MNSQFLIILIILVPIGIFIYMRRKKKKAKETSIGTINKKLREDNESWKVIKKYLHDHDEYGKEVIELFVTREHSKHDLSNMSKEQKKIYKKEENRIKKLKKSDPKEYKRIRKTIKLEKKEKPPEYWMLVFITRNPKTNIVDPQRVVKAEIIHEKISKKKTERKIVISDNFDHVKAMEWILPIKEKEDVQINKQKKLDGKHELKNKIKEDKRKIKKANPDLISNKIKVKKELIKSKVLDTKWHKAKK